ncbi:hypothetical protein K0M31_014008 [Melipona bicolor]|uniref:Uncharacterized protein n=1 Tax=Melipona bicolor TaxID=60889 RepID=A0AA40G7P2_9HYME|nr:hypothetical protein K0M31_014008 [Melipona bicolor]
MLPKSVLPFVVTSNNINGGSRTKVEEERVRMEDRDLQRFEFPFSSFKECQDEESRKAGTRVNVDGEHERGVVREGCRGG